MAARRVVNIGEDGRVIKINVAENSSYELSIDAPALTQHGKKRMSNK